MTKQSTLLAKEPTTSITLPLSDLDNLKVDQENGDIYYWVTSDGCPNYLVRSVQEAVTFIFPHLGHKVQLIKSRDLISKIIQLLPNE